ncbi:MAG: hypothetical protein ACLR1R_06420 [Ruminococcus callidus]
MNQTIYRVLHIYDGDYGCEEHAEPTAEVVLKAADGSRKTISYSDAALYTLDIFEGDSVTYTDGTLQKSSRNRIRNQKDNTSTKRANRNRIGSPFCFMRCCF